MKKVLLIALSIIFAVSAASCQKEPEPAVKIQEPGAAAPHAPISVPQERQLVVPDDVKGKWASVVLNVEDKAAGKITEQNIVIGGEYAIPNTGIKIKVVQFLPDFVMEGAVITTRSADPNNPAVKVTITDGEEVLFDSWLYGNHPSIHPFDNEKYGVTLKEGKLAG